MLAYVVYVHIGPYDLAVTISHLVYLAMA